MSFSNFTKSTVQQSYRDNPDRDDAASVSSALPLREQAHLVNDPDLPPYADDEPQNQIPQARLPQPFELRTLDAKVVEHSHTDAKGSIITRLSPTLTTDPVALQTYIEAQSRLCPRASVHVKGTHWENQRTGGNNQGKKKVQVVDFDFDIDVTDTISRSTPEPGRFELSNEWTVLGLVDHGRKVYRGGIMKSRGKQSTIDPEGGAPEPTLQEWCHLFCASGSKLKCFTLHRSITDRDTSLIGSRLTSYIVGTNYRGHVSISYNLSPHTTIVTTSHLLNRLRYNTFVYWICIIVQLWIITWPVLWLMTRRWSVVEVFWPYRRATTTSRNRGAGAKPFAYVRESEEEWCQRWKYTVTKAVETKWQGVLERTWIQEADGQRSRTGEPHAGFVGAAVGLFRGISGVLSEADRIRGWGGDTF